MFVIASPKRSNPCHAGSWIASSQALLAMTQTRLRDLAARCARSFANRSALLEFRGRRESRVRAAPAVPCANAQESAHTSIQVQRRASGFPCAMGLRLIRDLPGEPSSVATVTSQMTSAKLGASFGRQDHTISPYATGAYVTSAAASTASRPAAVTIACRPSVGRDNEGYIADLLQASRIISENQKIRLSARRCLHSTFAPYGLRPITAPFAAGASNQTVSMCRNPASSSHAEYSAGV